MCYVTKQIVITGIYMLCLLYRPGSINMEWMMYMTQPCGTSVEEVHQMTTDAIESSLGAVKMESAESVSVAQIVGE